MTVIPRSWLERTLIALWTSLCLAVLVFAYVQRHIHDTDIAFAYFMLFLTFPAGYIFASAVGLLFYALYETWGIVVPGGFINNLVAWLTFVAVGYFQWFILLPWCYHKLKSSFT